MHDEALRTPALSRPRRRSAARALSGKLADHPGPDWFASVMGTGILATAAALLPVRSGAVRALGLGAWILAAGLLVVLLGATVAQWLLHPERARGHHLDPRMAPFYGAPPMAMLTVGAGALLLGKDLIGLPAAVRVDEALWTVGTVTGLVGAVAIPYLMFTRHRLQLDDTLGSWLMPIVPPMVSAAAGAALIAHLPTSADRLTMLLACYAMFGISLFGSLIIIALLWSRLLYHGLPPAGLVPTLWIVLGPLGQSVTAAALLAKAALHVLPAPDAPVLGVLALAYGIPAWGFALSWMAIAVTITIHTARQGLPFSLSWWSFTFPVGTVVTGTSQLAQQTHAAALTVIAVGLYAMLTIGWAAAATGTARGILSGELLPPRAAGLQSA